MNAKISQMLRFQTTKLSLLETEKAHFDSEEVAVAVAVCLLLLLLWRKSLSNRFRERSSARATRLHHLRSTRLSRPVVTGTTVPVPVTGTTVP
jgi:hypothetical protein